MNEMIAVFAAISSSGLIDLLMKLALAALCFWLIWYVIGWMKVPEPGATILRVIVGLIVIVFLLRVFGIY